MTTRALASRFGSPDVGRGGVRPLRRDDLGDVARLRLRCFPFDPPPAPNSLEKDLAEVFLDNPWSDSEIPSLVYDDGNGRIIGFLGVVPRPMTLGGMPILAAATSRLMVEPERRGLAALRLVQTFFRGSQDLSLADVATNESRVLWERLGGTTALPYSLEWFRPLAPAGAALGWLAHVARSGTLELAARSLGRVFDAALVRLGGELFRRRRPRADSEPMSDDELLRSLDTTDAAAVLRPRYDIVTLEWILWMLGRTLRGISKALVRDGDHVIGWYVYGIKEHRIAQVVRLAAAPGRFNDVLACLFDDATSQGAVAVAGRLEPTQLGELNDRLCVLRRAPWILVHSRSRAVLDVVARGDAVLSRMEGEWWMPV